MLRCAKMINLGHGLWSLLIVMLLLGGFRSGFAQSGAISTVTTSALKKSNQSKVFYHDNKWWAVAYDSVKAAWLIWRYDNPAWVATKALQLAADNSLDVLMDSATNKLYVFSSHTSQSRFRRFSYSAGTWILDPGFPVLFSGFINPNGNNPVSLLKAKNGELWLFRVNGVNKLQIKVSSNNGTTWSANKNIKTLSQTNGTTDAVAFSDGVNNYVGVGYGEVGAAASSFGFLRHRDGDPITTWTDESAALTYLGTERAQNEIAMTVDSSNVIYMFTRTSGGAVGNPRNTLYQRSAGGIWTPFIVNAIGTRSWFSPAVVVDSENRRLIVMGTNQNNNLAEYKVGVLGAGSDLQSAAVLTLTQNGTNVFRNLSAPAWSINATTGLMATAGDTTANDTWFNRLSIPASAPAGFASVALSDSIVNADAAYTLVMSTSGGGALAANFSTITVRFPNNTFVPAVITPAYIRVNGTPVTIASANSLTREITLTTPVAVGNIANFTVAFSDTLGLLNPTIAGAYTIQAWTSQQTTPATSPSYNIISTTSTVSAVKATTFPADVDSASQYRVGFRVGANGRLFSDSSKVTIHFANDTKIKSGVLLGVTLNGISATAIGDTVNRRIEAKVPAGLTVNNGDSVTVFMPRTTITNPSRVDTFNLQAATSVEPTPITSNNFYTHKGRRIAGTTKNFERGNQSKMFYHGGSWWLAAQSTGSNFWHLWKRSSTDTTWTQSTQIHNQGKSRPDCILNAINNKVYILLPGSSTASLTRLSFAAGSWTVDSGYPKAVSTVQEKHMNLARAVNGELWVFWYADSTLFARLSTNEGSSWSTDIVVKTNLNSAGGLQDAVSFSNGGDFIGVGYAENNDSPNSIYGFLRHADGDSPTSWTDETASIPQFASTNADDHISMIAYNGEVFMVVKTGGGGATAVHEGMFHRNSGGTWNSYAVADDASWTRLTLALDETNAMFYVFGTREGDVQYLEGKSVALGAYSSFIDAPIDTFMHSRVDDFFDVSSPAHTVTGASDLLIAATNATRNEIWVQYIGLADGIVVAKSQPESDEGAARKTLAVTNNDIVVGAYPNPMNPSTQIQFTLKVAAPVKLQIFNINGQLVKTLVDNDLAAGTHRRMWRGTNQEGHIVSSGTYFYRLQVGGVMKTGQLYMIK
ncbi:MAG: T9SS type A sorting domain-containing protein [bacterium]